MFSGIEFRLRIKAPATQRKNPFKEIVKPAFYLFLNAGILANILNPIKFTIVQALYAYWTEVSKRGLLVLTTDLEQRFKQTQSILAAINQPDKEFCAVVRQNIDLIKSGSLKGYLENALTFSLDRNKVKRDQLASNLNAAYLAGSIAMSTVTMLLARSVGIGMFTFVLLEVAHAALYRSAVQSQDQTESRRHALR